MKGLIFHMFYASHFTNNRRPVLPYLSLSKTPVLKFRYFFVKKMNESTIYSCLNQN